MKASRKARRPASPLNKRAPDATRAKLLVAAGRMFAERGYHATTVRDICFRAGANVALVNYYFGGKQGLYTAVLHQLMARSPHLEEMRGALDQDAPPEDTLRAVIKARLHGLCPGVLADEKSRILMHELAQPTPALTRVINDISRPLYERMLALVGGIIGRRPHDEKTRLCVHSVMGQMIVYALARPFLVRLWPELKMTPAQLDRIAGHIADFSLAYLGQAGNRKAAAKTGVSTKTGVSK
ncbi:MAG TPA: CerR family C-terminal domain-containing protein [Bryobacteraceae bacterium]|nr:CerR family C-terminal domain-containing protein [Bryobacteraceae bacterium]HXJ42455.1 CerR family C-terminal domain-containing protein [Bryobacteraceae bacterium]